MSEAQLKDVYQAFVSFGTRDASVTGLDNAKFFKMFNESGLLGKALARQDVDLAFAKVKPSPSARRIDFPQFKAALRILAPKKYPKSSEDEAYQKLVNVLVSKGGPGLSGVTVCEPSTKM